MNTGIEALHISGIYAEYAAPDVPVAGRPPLLFVHGGGHGSWMWHDYMAYAADRRWDAYALNWLSHYGSRELPRDEFVARSIGDVRYEIAAMADHIGVTPILVGHSMGGLACLSYASTHPIAGLALLTPGVPAAIGGPPMEIGVDLAVPWGPPPFDVARGLFFQGLDEPVARRYHALLQPESPRAVWEVTRWTLEVDVDAVTAPALVVGGEDDRLSPAPRVAALADRIGAVYHLARGRGHGIPYDPAWVQTASLVLGWADTVRAGEPADHPRTLPLVPERETGG